MAINATVKKVIPKATTKKIAPKAAAKKVVPKKKWENTKMPVNQILIKKREAILFKEISFLEKNMSNYKLERKANWKLFKNKMEVDLDKIKQSIRELTSSTE
jgi:hypothetical protein